MNWASQLTPSTTMRMIAVAAATPANMSVILPRYDICRDFWFERVFHEALEPIGRLERLGNVILGALLTNLLAYDELGGQQVTLP